MRRQRERTRTTATEDGRPVLDGFATAAGPVPARFGGANPPAPMPGNNATARTTRGAMPNAGNYAGVAQKLASINVNQQDIISDEEARRNADVTYGVEEPRTPETLPAIISTAMTVAGDIDIRPNWHMVRNLPGYQRNAIRAIGRQVFSPFTDTPIEDIQTVTTLSNPEIEVKALMAWIARHGVRDDKMEMDFRETIPDYGAKVQIWSMEEYTFMLVQDQFGHYVYGWPGGRGIHLEQEAPRPMLR